MANFASLRGPVGMNRVFARIDPPLTAESFATALRAGRTFVTDGPLLELIVEGEQPGDELEYPSAMRTLRHRMRYRSVVPLDHVQLVMNGKVVEELIDDGKQSCGGWRSGSFEATESGWILMRAWYDRAVHPVLDLYPYATTSPIYLTLEGRPRRSPGAAAYFAAWIDRLIESTRARDDFNTAEEKESALATFERARKILMERR